MTCAYFNGIGLKAADRGITRGRRDEIDRAVDETHQPHRPFWHQVCADVEDDAIGVMPLGGLPADLLDFRLPTDLVERPEPDVGRE